MSEEERGRDQNIHKLLQMSAKERKKSECVEWGYVRSSSDGEEKMKVLMGPPETEEEEEKVFMALKDGIRNGSSSFSGEGKG